jgi:hypothetical protein
MEKVLLSPLYEITPPNTPPTESLFGFAFYAEDVGSGKIEEGYSEKGEHATIVSFADTEGDPVVNTGINEAYPKEDVAQAIHRAIKHKNQLLLFR